MPSTIAQLGKRLEELGWKVDRAEFGHQSWVIPTENGHAVIEVRIKGNGIVGQFTLIGHHYGDDEDADGWETEDAVLHVDEMQSGGIPVHRSEEDLANVLARHALILATRVEREE